MGYNKFKTKSGTVLLDLTSDTIAPEELSEGITAHNKNGDKITGTFTIDNELTTQDELITQIQAAVDNLPEAGSGNVSYDTCTVAISSNSSIPALFYHTIENGIIVPKFVSNFSSYEATCLCNSGIALFLINNYGISESKLELIGTVSGMFYAYKVTANKEEVANLYVNQTPGGGSN